MMALMSDGRPCTAVPAERPHVQITAPTGWTLVGYKQIYGFGTFG